MEPAHALSAPGKRILVAEDRESNALFLQEMLTAQGYRVTVARDGLEALELVEKTLPDLILLDVMMPRLDGLEVARRLRAREAFRATPILMVTALSTPREKAEGLEAGADDFLSKPYDEIELLARVRSLLRIKVLHDELQQKNTLLELVINRYVSKEIAREILSNPEQNLKLGGFTALVSVMFVDIRGFTHFAENREAFLVIEVLNLIFNHLTPVIFEYQGTLDKYLGDAIMALFGAPLARAHDAERAVRAAMAIQERFSSLRDRVKEIEELSVGIGICTGEAVVGNVGTEEVMDYTVIGNTPNTASRLQQVAGAGQILIDETTWRMVRHIAEVRAIEPLHLKGRTDPVNAFEVISVR